MERTITNVPPDQKNFVIALAKADGLTDITVIDEPGGTFTIIARKPATAPLGASGAPAIKGGVSMAAANFMLEHERFVPFRYHDIGDNATIGYGHHKGKTKAQIDAEFANGLTEEEAWQLFQSDVANFAQAVKSKAQTALAQNQFDALVMVAFQKGNANDQLVHANSGNHEAVASSIEAINTSGGKFSSGVASRMKKVANIYRHGLYPKPETTREKLRARGLKDIKDLYPNKLNSVGNKFGRPAEENQKRQAELAYFRMTGTQI